MADYYNKAKHFVKKYKRDKGIDSDNSHLEDDESRIEKEKDDLPVSDVGFTRGPAGDSSNSKRRRM